MPKVHESPMVRMRAARCAPSISGPRNPSPLMRTNTCAGSARSRARYVSPRTRPVPCLNSAASA
ncbi:MAG: hypothetical protein DMG03_21270 [Acidobacteria bacterium]|nr:MAG: hypothetical protein DMG03_21270 [Acidobacteriota bacterium]